MGKISAREKESPTRVKKGYKERKEEEEEEKKRRSRVDENGKRYSGRKRGGAGCTLKNAHIGCCENATDDDDDDERKSSGAAAVTEKKRPKRRSR